MYLIPGINKEDHDNYVLYFIENISDELKQEIRNRLATICYGVEQTQSNCGIYSYEEIVKDFIHRYKTQKDKSESRKKGMIGELLVHIILELEGKYSTASPFFNMEESSFKKGFDIVLFEEDSKELWITETKSGEIQKKQKNANSAVSGLINTAKKDLKKRLNSNEKKLWLNALNAARIYMNNSDHQKQVVLQLLGEISNNVVKQTTSSNQFNVVLSSVLFHPLSDSMENKAIEKKYSDVVKEKLFNKTFIIAIQKNTYTAVYNFLESEIQNEL